MTLEDIYRKFNKMNDKWMYRYRSASALSMKELVYNEIYFAYPDELNDPLDLGAELVINQGSEFVYNFFLSGAFKSISIPRDKEISQETKKVISEISIQYSKTNRNIKELFFDDHKSWLKQQIAIHKLKVEEFDRLYTNLLNIVSNLLPNKLLSVSFSKNYKNPLLWSLYAERHSGFCLIFNPSAGKLKMKDSIDSDYKEHELQKVNYSNDINVDLSLMFNGKNEFDWNVLHDSFFPKLIEKALLTKNSDWYKESEYRIHKGASISFSHFSKEQERLTSFEKTCHFDPLQLVGVIFGYKMEYEQRKEIIKIFESKKQSIKIFEAIPDGNEIVVQFVQANGHQ